MTRPALRHRAAEWAHLHRSGVRVTDIARRYGVDRKTVSYWLDKPLRVSLSPIVPLPRPALTPRRMRTVREALAATRANVERMLEVRA